MQDGNDLKNGVPDSHYTFQRWLPAIQNDWAARADWCVADEYSKAYELAEELRKEYNVSILERPKKLGKYLDKLEKNKYYGYLVFGEGTEVKAFANN